MARPLKMIDSKSIELLAGCGCTVEEIGSKLDCSADTLTRRYADSLEKGKNVGKTSLRSKQYELAMKGNVSMLIWLGKNLLGQQDVSRQTIDLGSLTPEQALAILVADGDTEAITRQNNSAASMINNRNSALPVSRPTPRDI